VTKYVGKPFDWGAMMSSVLRIMPSMDKRDAYFCSELVTAALRDAGTLPQAVRPGTVVPVDFVSADRDGDVPSDLFQTVIQIFRR